MLSAYMLFRMDRLWTPWRYSYVSRADKHLRKGVPEALDAGRGDHNCVFCNMAAAVQFAVDSGMSAEAAEQAAHIIDRGKTCFVCLNAFPYSTGHVMVVPYLHTDSLAVLDAVTAQELIALAQGAERA